MFSLTNIVIWSKTLSAGINSMDLLYGASTSVLYAATIVSGKMLISRVDTVTGDFQWTYGFKCSNNKKNLKTYFRQNVVPSFNVLAATC
jgi:hypothetical protein